MRYLFVCLLVLLALPAAALEPYLVEDIEVGPAGSAPMMLVRVGDVVLFFAGFGPSGRELWRSDGTAAGTFQLTDTQGAFQNSYPYLVTERLAFLHANYDRLWVSDGTAAGTFPLTEPGLLVHPWRVWMPSQGVLYFSAQDWRGSELWRTDGTVAGTHAVTDLRPGLLGSDPRWLTVYQGRVWFAANDGERGGALWSTDGTEAGTVLAVDPLPASAARDAPEQIQVVGNRIAFFARAAGPGRGRQLWAGDGTQSGTAPITNLSKPAVLHDSIVHGNKLWFVAEDRKGQELWVSDGTARGTRVLTSFANRQAFFSGSSYHLSRRQGPAGRLVFIANDGPHGVELWASDGTPKGTRLLQDACPGQCSGFPGVWGALGGRAFFEADDQSFGRELWSTDGTPQGTRRLTDICPGPCGAYPLAFFVLNDRVVFPALGPDGWEVWSTDGAEIVQITDFEARSSWEENGFQGAVLDGKLLFNAFDSQHGMELWAIE